MEICLIAKMKNYDEFIMNFIDGDENRVYKGKSLLFYSLSNNDADSRYMISVFLLNKCARVNVTNECGESLLHILFSRNSFNIIQTAELCKILIDKGIDINQLDQKKRVALQYLIISKYTDQELEPIYQVLFSQGNILVNQKNAWGKTPMEIAEQLPYRKSLLERMRIYE